MCAFEKRHSAHKRKTKGQRKGSPGFFYQNTHSKDFYSVKSKTQVQGCTLHFCVKVLFLIHCFHYLFLSVDDVTPQYIISTSAAMKYWFYCHSHRIKGEIYCRGRNVSSITEASMDYDANTACIFVDYHNIPIQISLI